MTPEELFTAALGLGRQWRVAECRFEGEPKRLELRLEHVPGEHFEYPQCKAFCGVHDTLGSALALKTKVVIVNELKYEVCATVVTDDLRADLILIRLRL